MAQVVRAFTRRPGMSEPANLVPHQATFAPLEDATVAVSALS
jgi:hypothetical protein